MKTLNVNVWLNQGADFSVIIRILCDPPPDLTGYQFKSQIRLSSGSDVVAEFDFELRDQVLYPGEVYWKLSAADSEAIAAFIIGPNPPCRPTTPYVFDIKMIDTTGDITRILQGIVNVSPDVTREETP